MKHDLGHIKLVSLHIPKTAGTSFRTVLQKQYGIKRVARLDIYKSGDIYINEKNWGDKPLNKKIEVIHGHFSYADFSERFEMNQSEVPIITWLRDPVDRVVSNYFFLNKIIADRLQEAPEEKLMSRMGKSIEEFVSMEENQNVMSKFLKGSKLSDFKFVGDQNRFDEELLRLQHMMNWKVVTSKKHNVTGTKRVIDEQTKSLITQLNSEDCALYENALALNKSNLNLRASV